MNPTGLAGLVLVVLAAILLPLLAVLHRRYPVSFRNIRAYARIQRAVRLVVEDGTRFHFALGNGNMLTSDGASALAGLVLLRHLGEIASLSDRPPVATTGNAVLNLLAQDTLFSAHVAVGVEQTFENNNAQLVGFTPLSYAAGVMPIMSDESVSSNVIIGSFGPEVGLLTEAAARHNAALISASDSLTAQAVLYASSPETLIGEELFAAGAYTQGASFHSASLILQDVFRWLIIGALLALAGLRLAGIR